RQPLRSLAMEGCSRRLCEPAQPARQSTGDAREEGRALDPNIGFQIATALACLAIDETERTNRLDGTCDTAYVPVMFLMFPC
ncbi:MAG: hypothetical protein KIT00_03525, partial [Rhodospirillales bacterium]|nr:hypothetical protein [Rhodospirillales bacterium]